MIVTSILALALAAGGAPDSSVLDTAAVVADTTRHAAPAGGLRAVPARIGRAARNLAGDIWLVASSPGRIDRRGAAGLAIVLAAGGVLYAYDEELLDASLRNREDPVWKGIQDVGTFVEPVGYMGNTMSIYIGACVLGYATGIEPLKAIPLQIIESHLISGGARNVCKLLIGRRRPFEGKGPYFFEFNGGTSFPSGHSSVLFEVATILSHHAHSTPATVLLYALAGAGSLERVHTRAHWPSDLILSAVSGTLIARIVVQRHEERAARAQTGLFLDARGTPRLGVRLAFGAR